MSKFDMTILPINDDQDDYKLKRDICEDLPDVRKGVLLLVIGAVRSGKSVYGNNLIYNPNFYYDIFDNIHYISPSVFNDDSCKYIRQGCNCYDKYNDGIIDNIVNFQTSFTNKSKRPSVAIFLDDVIGEIPVNSSAYALTTKYRHLSRCVMVCIMTQKFRKIPVLVRSNVNAVTIMSGIFNKKEQQAIAEEYADYFKMTEKEFIQFYINHTKEKYSFIHLNMITGKIYYKHEKVIYDKEARTKENENIEIVDMRDERMKEV